MPQTIDAPTLRPPAARTADPCAMVIFGASGDLTSRKLVPALYWLFRKRRLPDGIRIVGFSRTPMADQAWRDALGESTAKFVGSDFDAAAWRQFAASIYYHAGDVGTLDDFRSLRETLGRCEQGTPCVRIYYLATAPQFFEPTVANLGASGLADEQCGQKRLVVEKPFGTDLATARRLNEALAGWSGVRITPMFGRWGYFVGETLFGCFPLREKERDLWVRLSAGDQARALSDPRIRPHRRFAKKGWVELDVEEPEDLSRALRWLRRAHATATRASRAAVIAPRTPRTNQSPKKSHSG